MAKPRNATVVPADRQPQPEPKPLKLRPVRNQAQYLAAAARRASNAAVPIPSGTRYVRRRKHRGRPLDSN